jgi:predicted transposase YdaD
MSKRISKLGVPNPNQHQDFDKIIKKTFTRVYTTLIQKLLGLDLQKTVEIPTTFSKTKEKRADFAVKVMPQNEEPHIVHVEFQTRGVINMHIRELGYYHDFLDEFGLEVRQYVIFMGNGEHKMIDTIRHKNLNFSYKIIVLKDLDAQIFLDSDNPHELILAILCKYEKKNAPILIKQILEKLKSLAQNERDLYEYTTDLEILSGLRKLQSETKKQIDKMPITYDLTKDLRYKEGKLEGKLEGEAIGEQKGELRKARIAVINMLKMQTFSIEQIAGVLEVTLDFVKKIQSEWIQNPHLKA